MNPSSQEISWSVLDLDLEPEASDICERIRRALSAKVRRRGLVVAISGGIDSSTCLGLAVRAVGASRVLALILPERDSSSDSAVRARALAQHVGVAVTEMDIAPTLEAIGCYRSRDEAIRRAVPQYEADWRMKIVIAGGLEGRVNSFRIVAQSPDGRQLSERLGLQDYLQIVAATNFKQRIRKTIEYYHADRLNYAVVGTPNLLEYDQGFFVKNGDGSADIKPIAHLYKSQVYAMAAHLKLPPSVLDVIPTTDTYSLPQGQDEFYFSLPYKEMDMALWCVNHGIPEEKLARLLSIPLERAQAVYVDIENKRRAAQYLHEAPILMRAPARPTM